MNQNKSLRITALCLSFFMQTPQSFSAILPSIEFESIFGLGDGDGGGQVVGNGGDLVVCYMGDGTPQVKTAELSDFFEGREIYQHVHLEKQQDDLWKLKWPHIVKIVLDDLRIHDPQRADFYEKQVPIFVDAENSHTGRNQDVGFLSGLELPDVPDSGGIILPANCVIKQGAIFKTREFPDEPIFLINRDYWKHLSEMSKAGLVLHELIFKEAKTFAAVNSRAVRNFNSLLFTLSLGKRSFSDYLKRIALTTIKKVKFGRDELLTNLLGNFDLLFSVSTNPTQAGDAFLKLNKYEETDEFVLATDQNLRLKRPANNRVRTIFDSSFSYPEGLKEIGIDAFLLNKKLLHEGDSRLILNKVFKRYDDAALVRNSDGLKVSFQSGLLLFDKRGELTSELAIPCTENDLKLLETTNVSGDPSTFGYFTEFANVGFTFAADDNLPEYRELKCGNDKDLLSMSLNKDSSLRLQNKGLSRDNSKESGVRHENFLLTVVGLEKMKWTIFGRTWTIEPLERKKVKVLKIGVSIVVDLKNQQLYFGDSETAGKWFSLTSK